MYLEVRLGELNIRIQFLVVKGLNMGVILGSDTLGKKEMTTDFRKRQLCFEHVGK